eukprot:2419331-Pleurochrysis_carterae.AAC.1
MAQPPFQAWMKNSRCRVQLVMSFKLMVLMDTGDLVPPPNCVYNQSNLQASKELGVKVLHLMVNEGLLLSAKFYFCWACTRRRSRQGRWSCGAEGGEAVLEAGTTTSSPDSQ